MRSGSCSVFAGGLLMVCVALPASAEDTKVRQKQSLSDLLSEKPGSHEGQMASSRETSGLAVKVALWSGVLIVGACCLGVVRRASKRPRLQHASPGGVEVAGRISLSHKHSVFVLRLGGKRLAVGVGGDRITALGIWDESPESPALPEHSAPVPARTGGFTIRPQDREAMSAAQSFRDTDFLPYRKQVERLRGLLRGLRPEDNPGPGLQDKDP